MFYTWESHNSDSTSTEHFYYRVRAHRGGDFGNGSMYLGLYNLASAVKRTGQGMMVIARDSGCYVEIIEGY